MREWWLRSVLVLAEPRAVFVALRRDAAVEPAELGEPVLAIVLLAGIAFVLSTPTASHLLDDPDYDTLLLCVWAFLAGALSGGFAYWLLGGVLHLGVRALGSHGSFRRSRHILAFAAVPIACSLLLWPFKLALYGGRLFHSGGAGVGRGEAVFRVLEVACAVWAGWLLVTGVRAVHGWSWRRSALGAAAPLALALLLALY